MSFYFFSNCHLSMNELVQELIQRRIHSCDHGSHFYHAACTFLPKKLQMISYGMNHFSSPSRLDVSTHAEIDALLKLRKRENHKRGKKINLLIIRTTKMGKLCMSKPCEQCVLDMLRIAPRQGYKIDWIYYSTATGDIHRVKLERSDR